VYIYREGFARFSATRYQAPTHENIGNSYIHLTNVAIQKKGEDYDAASGGKMDLRTLKLYLATKHGTDRVNQVGITHPSLRLHHLHYDLDIYCLIVVL
jgi:tubulin polyglutamylase TTLL9